MKTQKTVNLEEFTQLPVRVVMVKDKMMPDIIVSTPHKGDVLISLTTEHYPFIFGSVTQTERHTNEVVKDLERLEKESMEFLFKSWKDKKLTHHEEEKLK